MSSAQTNEYAELNKFQQAFFTSVSSFNKYTNFEVKKFGYILLNNIAKGFPNLADIIINLKGIEWSGVKSPELFRALQYRFVCNPRVPQFVYYKNQKPAKTKEKVTKVNKDLLEFDEEIRAQICSILMIDSKTYELLKFTEKVQYLGKQIYGEFMQNKKIKK